MGGKERRKIRRITMRIIKSIVSKIKAAVKMESIKPITIKQPTLRIPSRKSHKNR